MLDPVSLGRTLVKVPIHWKHAIALHIGVKAALDDRAMVWTYACAPTMLGMVLRWGINSIEMLRTDALKFVGLSIGSSDNRPTLQVLRRKCAQIITTVGPMVSVNAGL